MTSNLKERAKQIVIEQLGVEDSEIKESAHIQEDLGADSLDVVELIMAIEEEFEVEIPDEDAETLTTFGALTEYVSSKLAE